MVYEYAQQFNGERYSEAEEMLFRHARSRWYHARHYARRRRRGMRERRRAA